MHGRFTPSPETAGASPVQSVFRTQLSILAIPSMWNHGFRCPTDHANVLGADALDSLGTLPVDRAAGHDTFTLETRQWETVPAWQLDAKLDELLGKPVKTWTWSGVTLTQRHGALQLKEMPGMDEHCDGR